VKGTCVYNDHCDFLNSLPPEYQAVLEQAQERYQILITPLQELRGGQTGARLQLVSIRGAGRTRVEHAVPVCRTACGRCWAVSA